MTRCTGDPSMAVEAACARFDLGMHWVCGGDTPFHPFNRPNAATYAVNEPQGGTWWPHCAAPEAG